MSREVSFRYKTGDIPQPGGFMQKNDSDVLDAIGECETHDWLLDDSHANELDRIRRRIECGCALTHSERDYVFRILSCLVEEIDSDAESGLFREFMSCK